MNLRNVFVAALLATSTAALADTHDAMSSGTATKVDSQWYKVTIDHGPLDNLDMPAMKMVFQVADPAMLEGLEAGTPVVLSADRINGKLTVTALER